MVEKKRKVSCLATNKGEKLKQAVFLMFMCGLRPLAHINIYKSMYSLRYELLSVFLYKKYNKKVQVPP